MVPLETRLTICKATITRSSTGQARAVRSRSRLATPIDTFSSATSHSTVNGKSSRISCVALATSYEPTSRKAVTVVVEVSALSCSRHLKMPSGPCRCSTALITTAGRSKSTSTSSPRPLVRLRLCRRIYNITACSARNSSPCRMGEARRCLQTGHHCPSTRCIRSNKVTKAA